MSPLFFFGFFDPTGSEPPVEPPVGPPSNGVGGGGGGFSDRIGRGRYYDAEYNALLMRNNTAVIQLIMTLIASGELDL